MGDAHGPTKATVSRALQRVVEAINDQLFQTMDISNMPCVIGCIDGTATPFENEKQYVHGYGQHSINTMTTIYYNLKKQLKKHCLLTLDTMQKTSDASGTGTDTGTKVVPVPQRKLSFGKNLQNQFQLEALALYLTPLDPLLTSLDQYPVFEFLLECENVK
uniref:Uncharacterized protein n=1 Tax=Romanomermis culicivorax TaxID=13658 RepID=A0A915I0A4_ROMCU